MVGSYLVDRFASLYDLLVPSHAAFDITNRDHVMAYVLKNRPDVVIHAAGVTDPKNAEKERGDESGLCFRTNVLGTRYMKEASERVGAFLIHISTGSVFFGNDKSPGPFREDAPIPKALNGMSWYGWTKVLSEREVGKGGAIVRLSKPLQEISFDPKNSFARPGLAKLKKCDYLGKLLFEYENHMLAGLMHDQYFPVVSMDEVARLLRWIIDHKKSGIYHAASPDVVSPIELFRYALLRPTSPRECFAGLRKCAALRVMGNAESRTIQSFTFDEFVKTQELPLRYQKYSAIDSRGTVEKTGIQFLPWKKAVDKIEDLHTSVIARPF